MQITQQGQAFVSYARTALSQWHTIRNQVQNAQGQLQGEVSLYCSVTAVYSLLFDLFQRFRQDRPNIEIKLHTGDPDQGITHVLSGEEDLAIAARPKTLPRELALKKNFKKTFSECLMAASLTRGRLMEKVNVCP